MCYFRDVDLSICLEDSIEKASKDPAGVYIPRSQYHPEALTGSCHDPSCCCQGSGCQKAFPCSNCLRKVLEIKKTTWLTVPPARQPAMFPTKKMLAIQEPWSKSSWMGSSGSVWLAILGRATLEKEIQPPAIAWPQDTARAHRTCSVKTSHKIPPTWAVKKGFEVMVPLEAKSY